MTLSKYKLSLLAAAGAECDTDHYGVRRIHSFGVYKDGEYEGQPFINIMVDEGKWTLLANEVTPIMRSINQMTPTENKEFYEHFGFELVYNKDGVVVAGKREIVGYEEMFDEIEWICKIGAWPFPKDFTNNLIKQKQIKT